MRKLAIVLIVIFCWLKPAVSQQIDAATPEDIRQMLDEIGVSKQMETVYAALGQSMAMASVQALKQKNPQATPDQLQRVAVAVAQFTQEVSKVIPMNELIDVMVPVYQRYLTHSDVLAINEFYGSPTGKKMIRNMPAMMAEGMQAAQAVIQKHQPEMQAIAEKAAAAGQAADPNSSPAQK